ncbi:MAG: MerR family transcriptional regulator [Geminicoccaceae bacterium]
MSDFAIGEAAKQSGVTIETIRYYEREGIVPAAERSANGHRRYHTEAIVRLRFVKRCRDLGFSISVIRALLSLASDEDSNCAKVKNIGEAHLGAVRSKITDLERLETALIELIAHCEAGRSDCPMLKELLAD